MCLFDAGVESKTGPETERTKRSSRNAKKNTIILFQNTSIKNNIWGKKINLSFWNFFRISSMYFITIE